MMIHCKQGIEPIPVRVFGDPDSNKFQKTKKLGKQPEDNIYNFYGDYDLTKYLEDVSELDMMAQKKNLCLCMSTKKQAPVQDVIIVQAQMIDSSGKVTTNSSNYTLNWDVPDGYKTLSYSVGVNGHLNRLLCLKTRDIMRRRIKAKVIDRYPQQDRPYYPFPLTISDFCFPSGIFLKSDYH